MAYVYMMIIYNNKTGQNLTDSNTKTFSNWEDCIKDSYEAWPKFKTLPDWMGHKYIQYSTVENEKITPSFIGCPSNCGGDHIFVDHF